MLRVLAEKLQALQKKLTIEAVSYDPSHLGDEIATQTEWGPARSGGASFRTHRLVDAGPRRVEFRATGGARLFYAVFFVMGVLARGRLKDWIVGTTAERVLYRVRADVLAVNAPRG